MVLKIWVTFIILTVWNPSAVANQSHDVFIAASPDSSPNIIRHNLYSKNLQEERVIDVSLPVNYAETAENVRYPVFVVMDGELLFSGVSGVVEMMSMNSQMPESIVVGIYNTPDGRRNMMPRSIDKNGKRHRYGGKENQYLAFIQDEVLPMIDKNYRSASFRTMIGLSPSAKLTLHSFWKAPELFNAHVAIGASDFMAEGYEGESVFYKIEQVVAKTKDFKGWLYISAAPYNAAEILKKYKGLAKNLTPYIGNKVILKTEIVNKNGYAMALPSILTAIETIFPSKRWDVSYREFFSEKPGQTLKNVKNHFDALSKEYGFTALPKGERFYNRNRLKRLGYQLLAQERFSEAIAMFKYWKELYPSSANAYDSLADAYEANEQFDIALKARKKAVQLAKKNKDIRLSVFESTLKKHEIQAEG